MLHDFKKLFGAKLAAKDGDIGHVRDFYFDDQSWTIRYVVADTGSWLTGRQVLLAPRAFGSHALGDAAAPGAILPVNLTRRQIEDSPPIDAHRPVSRQNEIEYFNYYGWPSYWPGDSLSFGAGVPIAGLRGDEVDRPPGHAQRDDVHLRSMKAVAGYRLHATNGEIGEVRGFLVHDESWVIDELGVETGHWYAGKAIRVRTANILRIGYDDSRIFVNLALEDLNKTEPGEAAHAHGRTL